MDDLFQLEVEASSGTLASHFGPPLVRLLSIRSGLRVPVELWPAHPDSSSFFTVVFLQARLVIWNLSSHSAPVRRLCAIGGRLAFFPFGRFFPLAIWPFGCLVVFSLWPCAHLVVWPFGRLASDDCHVVALSSQCRSRERALQDRMSVAMMFASGSGAFFLASGFNLAACNGALAYCSPCCANIP